MSSRDVSDDMTLTHFLCLPPNYFRILRHFFILAQSISRVRRSPRTTRTPPRHAPKGGANNAFTDSERTVYYFEMDGSIDNRFSEALVRFGSFFSGPLFTESATGRELNAIDSEHAKNLQSDVFRLYELEKDRVNSAHP